MDFIINWLKTVLIGIVEGITEWLPVSSTGHMLLLDAWIKMDITKEFKTMFMVVIQLGAILAVVVVHWKKLCPFYLKKNIESPFPARTIKDFFFHFRIRKRTLILWAKIIIACFPAAVIGFLFDDILDKYLFNAPTIAITLIFYGILFIVCENTVGKRDAKIVDLAALDYKTALGIGCFQVLSLIPGTSRSGSTILGGLILGTSRAVVTEFTFFLGVPIMFGASFLKLLKFGFHFTFAEFILLLTGMIVAFLLSVLTIKFLLNYIKKHNFKIFGWYRIALGLLVLIIYLF